MPAQLLLGEDQLTVHGYLENSTRRGDEFRFDIEFLAKLRRQTGGAWLVVSNDAVGDEDVHTQNPTANPADGKGAPINLRLMRFFAASWCAMLVLVAGSAPVDPLQQPRPTRDSTRSAGEWTSAGRDDALTRWSPLDQINRENVASLAPAWTFSTGIAGPHEGSPLVVGSTMFVHTPYPNKVFALDLARPGAPVTWTYTAPSSPTSPTPLTASGSRGLAWHKSGKIYVPILSGELAALDGATGREIWRVRNSDWRSGALLSSAPLVAGNLVIVGMSGAARGVRGYLTAYDASNGRLVWRAWSTGPDTDLLLDGPANLAYPSHQGRDLGRSTWSGESWRYGGGTPSGWLSFDAALGLVYYGTDEPGPPNPAARPGENKWTSSILAREATTGRLRWALQLTPHDQWGYGAANENVLVDIKVAGRPVKALVHFDRNGFVYTIDRVVGKQLTAERFGPLNWALSVDPGTGAPRLEPKYSAPRGIASTSGVCPAAIGAKALQPVSFAPPSGLFFVPLNNLCMDMRVMAGGRDLATTLKPGPGNVQGRFIAWNAANLALVWENREPLPVSGGTLATAGGLVFYGTADGWLKALDQSSGRELWKYRTPGGILGSPIAFLGPDGKQYIAVLSGLPNGDVPNELSPGPALGILTVFGR